MRAQALLTLLVLLASHSVYGMSLVCSSVSVDSTQQVKPSISTLPLTRTSSLAGAEAAAYAPNSYPLPNRTVTIDGLPRDWQGIPPIAKDPKGDTERPVDDGSDLKALYVARDSLNLYFMAEFYAPANRSNLVVLDISDPSRTESFQAGADLSGVRYVWPWSSNLGIVAAYRDMVEFAVPLRLTPSPCINVQIHLHSSTGAFLDFIFTSPIWIDQSKGMSVEYRVTVHKASRLIEIYAHANNLVVSADRLTFLCYRYLNGCVVLV